MSYWSDITTTGSGAVDYRLMVEGWPHEWVTSPRITHLTNKQERIVYPGLMYTGLKISERIVLQDAWPTVGGITVTITPTDDAEDTVSGFTRDSRFVANLGADLADSDSSWVTLPATLQPGIYHLATEAVSCDGSNNITRGHWNTGAQKHVTTVGDISNPVPIYSWPPSMEGRRAYLYAYGTADDGDGDGNIIWRGVVSRPPRMGDGLSWTIQIDPITTIFDQNVGGGETTEYRVRGVYHSSSAPMTMWFKAGAQNYPATGVIRITGFFESHGDWLVHVNEVIDAAILTESLPDQLILVLATHTDQHPEFLGFIADDARFTIVVKDALDGDTMAGSPMSDTSGDAKTNGGEIVDGTFQVTCGDASGDFFMWSAIFLPPWSYPLPAGRSVVGKPEFPFTGSVGGSLAQLGILTAYYRDPTDTTWPNNRVYLESVVGLEVGDKLIVKDSGDDTREPLRLIISGINTTDRYLELDLSHSGFFYLSSDMTLMKITEYAVGSNWAGFMDAVIDASVDTNLGITPWITTNDVNITNWLDVWTIYPFHDYWRKRNYSFITPVRIKDVLTPEFMVTGWMARLALDGKVDVAQLPFVSPQRTAAHTITDDDILYPAGGMAGSWPTWEAQKDGLVNIAYLKLGYSPWDDDYDSHFDFVVRLTSSIAEHKSGDKAKREIGPKSRPSGAQTLKQRLKNLPPANDITDMVLPYLQTLSKDYATVTISVPFTKFGVLCGDIVSITSSQIPDGTGGRGVSGKKAICVGREWNLDPKQNAMGTLTFWFPRDVGRVAGYAPTGRVTGQSNTTGDVWVLTFSTAAARNIAWSEDSDGNVVKHFEVGDAIEVLEVDAASESRVVGIITDVPTSNQIEVTFNSTWTPGGALWNMRYAAGSPSSDHQLAYCWVADEDGVLLDGAAARSFL